MFSKHKAMGYDFTTICLTLGILTLAHQDIVRSPESR